MMVLLAVCLCCGQPFELVSAWYVFLSKSTKYELSNLSGSSDQAPSKPERSAWHLPTVCAPESATIALSSNPLGWKISRRWPAPLSPSGSRPCCDSTDSADDFASARPKRVGTSGPPMTRTATFAARAQRSACEMRSGQYLSVMGDSIDSATVGRPAFAAKVPSPASVKRMAAFGQPPASLPCEKTPASCQESRTSSGPHFRLATRLSSSRTR
mmetsp:Transcript_8953/g.26325  ORF Transcript_8953/g.26325 Transcript_8953/m.26325 type:complete len:213 (-) Transcript_8953:516-1154(-)